MYRKILLISDNKIFGLGGGSLEEHKYYDGIRSFIRSVGGELKTLSIDTPYEDSLTERIIKTRKADVLSRICGHSTYMYFVWNKHKREVYAYHPDVVVLGRSRLGFIIKDLKSMLPNTKIICNIENVEYDYIDGYFSGKSSLISKMYIALEKACVKRDESMCSHYADMINYLSQRDFQRTHEIYEVSDLVRETILPICIEKGIQLTKKNRI